MSLLLTNASQHFDAEERPAGDLRKLASGPVYEQYCHFVEGFRHASKQPVDI